MMNSTLFRVYSRNCMHISNNGLCQPTSQLLATQLSRALAVGPLRAAVLGSHASSSSSSPLLKKSPVNQQQSTVSRHMSSGGDHVKLWTAERLMSMVLLGAIPAAVAVPSPAVETFLALSLTIHSHWGVEALVHDYIRPSMFGNVIPNVAVATVYGLSMLTFGSLCFFIYTDVGLINAVSMLWKL